jgi:hypothetical protein
MANEAPLSISLSLNEVKTSIPIVADGTMVKARLKNISQQVVENKGNSTKWEYTLVDPAPTVEGGTVEPGFPVFENIQLYAKADAKNPHWFVEKIARRIDGLLGTGDRGNKKGKPERPEFNAETVAMLIGKEVILKLKVKTGEYEGNEIDKAIFPGDLA